MAKIQISLSPELEDILEAIVKPVSALNGDKTTSKEALVYNAIDYCGRVLKGVDSKTLKQKTNIKTTI